MSESSTEEARKIAASAEQTVARERAREAAEKREQHEDPPVTVRKAPTAQTKEAVLLPKGEEAKPDSVQKRATVHPKTVKKVGNGQIKTAKKARKRPAKKTAKKSAPKPDRKVSVITPLPAVWEAAKTLAHGNTKLLLVKSPTEVIVMNHPGQFERKAGN